MRWNVVIVECWYGSGSGSGFGCVSGFGFGSVYGHRIMMISEIDLRNSVNLISIWDA